jgi:hypothetical protein
MAVGDVILVGLAFVVGSLLCDKIRSKRLALEQVAFLFLVLEDAKDRCVGPLLLAVFGLPAAFFQFTSQDGRPRPFVVSPEDVADDFRLLGGR